MFDALLGRLSGPSRLSRTLGVWLTTFVLGAGTIPALADVTPPKAADKPATKATAAAMTLDPTTATQLSAFLHKYHQALSAGDHGFLAAHTVFPLPFAEAVYDMEAKIKSRTLASVDELLKSRESMLWPKELVPKKADDLAHLQRGALRCDDAKKSGTPDFTKGGAAIQLQNDQATLSYLAEPCDPTAHLVTLIFVHKDNTWRLRERAATRDFE